MCLICILLQNMTSSIRYQCIVACANVMTAPNHKCELHSQVLYGDIVEIMDSNSKNWSKVSLLNETFEGFVLTSQFERLDSNPMNPTYIVHNSNTILTNNNLKIQLPVGVFVDSKSLNKIDGTLLEFSSNRFSNEELLQVLNSYLKAPYMWGGNTIFGIDCSGLVQQLYRFYQINLPHVASAQMEWGEVVDFIQDVRFGDVAFFTNEEGFVNHVGIMLDSNRIIHSSESNGGVAVDMLDNEGIVNARTQKRTHQLRIIKRILTK